jgi:hypothetical protein
LKTTFLLFHYSNEEYASCIGPLNIATGVLGGTIQVHSTVDEGSRFVLTLPLSAPLRGPAAKV